MLRPCYVSDPKLLFLATLNAPPPPLPHIWSFFLWLLVAPRGGKINQTLRCDWLTRTGKMGLSCPLGTTPGRLPAISRKKHFPKSHTINSLLTKLVRSRFLTLLASIVLFLRVYGLDSVSVHKHAKKTWPMSSHLDPRVFNVGFNGWGQNVWILAKIFFECILGLHRHAIEK